MKVRTSVKPMCDKCKVIKRHGINSATSQETSATSEELTAQATTLSEMVAQFKLRND